MRTPLSARGQRIEAQPPHLPLLFLFAPAHPLLERFIAHHFSMEQQGLGTLQRTAG
jgi:hypothetical protein